jgi:hypothetical protein
MKENPLIPTRRPRLPHKGPKTENTKRKQQPTIYPVDVASADHSGREFCQMPKQDLEKQAKYNFHKTSPRWKPAQKWSRVPRKKDSRYERR